MAREATARLYDVDEDSVVFAKPEVRGKYDHGTVTFRAKSGKLVDLDKLHESVWATRLSGGTRSALVSLDVTAVGVVVVAENEALLKVTGSNEYFQLANHPDAKPTKGDTTKFEQLRDAVARGDDVVSVTGRLEGWSGHWPVFLREVPGKPRRLLVTDFQVAETDQQFESK